MNLLLLLSAMLSALTGGSAGMRQVQPAAAVAQAAQAQVARIASPVSTLRPQATTPALLDVRVFAGPAFSLVSAEAPFATRRRE